MICADMRVLNGQSVQRMKYRTQIIIFTLCVSHNKLKQAQQSKKKTKLFLCSIKVLFARITWRIKIWYKGGSESAHPLLHADHLRLVR